jgi:hypothetical protein
MAESLGQFVARHAKKDARKLPTRREREAYAKAQKENNKK